MIRDVAELADGAVLHADVAVIGAGFAGIDLARYLGRHGVRTVLLESGRSDFDPEIQELTRLISVGKQLRTSDVVYGVNRYLPPQYRGEIRIRQFGGNSNMWTPGRYKIFDELVFEKRPWVPDSGWPISLSDLRPFYVQIAHDYGFGDFDAFDHSDSANRLRQIARKGGLKLDYLFTEKEPIRLSHRFHGELAEARSVEVVLGATATEIVLEDDLKHVRSIVFQSLDSRRFTLVARYFVLAAGGLEVARLLLASNRQLPAGIGNRYDCVGRYYMDHLKPLSSGVLRVNQDVELGPSVSPAESAEPHFQVCFALSDTVQRAHSLPNHMVNLKPVYRYHVDYPAERVEAMKAAMRSGSVRRLLREGFMLAASPRALWKLIRRRMYEQAKGPISHYGVKYYLDQTPNPESRVYLGPERDVLGMPRLVMDWRLSPVDRRNFPRVLSHLTDAFAKAGIGRLDFGSEPLAVDDATRDAAHHMGTTRMTDTPTKGVVDRDCRVFGTDNLFVASGSAFPTGCGGAPTFTIMALARRVGAHLVELCSRRSAETVARGDAA